ncbi:MAG TPA: hypothetical protein PK637_18440, partial [Flavobacteriales bacterium]|nr:hypothetical protein [Flavobacteriales bacterium]
MIRLFQIGLVVITFWGSVSGHPPAFQEIATSTYQISQSDFCPAGTLFKEEASGSAAVSFESFSPTFPLPDSRFPGLLSSDGISKAFCLHSESQHP